MDEPSTSTAVAVYDLAESFHNAVTLIDDEEERAIMCIEEERLKTFAHWNIAFINKSDLAMLGFYFLKAPDTVKCTFCGVNICKWEPKHDILIEHFRLSQNCPLLNMRAVNNIPLDANELDRLLLGASYGSNEPQPETTTDISCIYPHYKTKEERFLTFFNWPSFFPKTPQELSEAGFFYMGVQDEVSCFSCGGSIVRWKEDDDVLEVHASRFTNCNFMKFFVGEEFIRDAKAKYDKSSETDEKTKVENQEISLTNSMQESGNRTRENLTQVPRQNPPNVHFEIGTPLFNFKFHIGDK